MAELAGVNASPLIVLARAGHFDLLKAAATRVIVPSVVIEEINGRSAGDPAVHALQAATWLERVDVPVLPPEFAERDLGPGESALLA